MSKLALNSILIAALLAGGLGVALGQEPTPLLTQPEDKLIAILQSQASQKEKTDACRQLAVIGTRDAVPALVALLADEKLNHSARYALETIPEPAVDNALRTALGELKGRPLVGVIGSLGVRRDTQAVEPLAKLLPDTDTDVAQAAARALGKIGNSAAAKALDGALANVPAANQLAFCEGLFRCAEALAATGRRDEALTIYERLRNLQGAPHQVRAGGLRGVILTRGKEGLPLLQESLRSQDFVLVAAAARAALEMTGGDVTRALTAGLSQLPADNQVLVIQTLGKRGDVAASPALFASVRSGPNPVRLAAIRALPEIGHSSAVPVLAGLLGDSNREIAQTARESLASLPGPDVDAAVVAMLGASEASQRLTAVELIGRRRMTASVPALLKAAADTDAKVRPAAIKKVGELGTTAEFPALLDLLLGLKASQDLDAAEQALSVVCAKGVSPESFTEKLTGLPEQAQPAQKSALLRVLASIGGEKALKAVRAAVDDANAEVHGAAIRALGTWKTAEAAPDLLALAKSAGDPTDKLLCLRSYLVWAAHPDLPAGQRWSMCQQAAGLIQRSEEKKLLLGALGNIATAESLALIAPHLDDAATREEASAATVAVAEKLLKEKTAAQLAPQLIEPLQKAAQGTANADLARRAKTLLQQAQSKAGAK
ncbi:MAG: HEAT repeat domain-containing protein [Verrucomicrobiota bacterium]